MWKLHLPTLKPLLLPCKRCAWMCQFWGRGLAINKWLIHREWLSFTQAVIIQTWLIERIHAEQKRLCQVHLKVLEECFNCGEIPAIPDNLDYFQDLRSLYIEGRYETMLIQLYQLDRKAALNFTQDTDDN